MKHGLLRSMYFVTSGSYFHWNVFAENEYCMMKLYLMTQRKYPIQCRKGKGRNEKRWTVSDFRGPLLDLQCRTMGWLCTLEPQSTLFTRNIPELHVV